MITQTQLSAVDASGLYEMLDAAPDPIVITREDGRIARVNAEAMRRFGYSRDEVIGQPIEFLVPTLCAGKSSPMGSGTEILGRCKGGEGVLLELSLRPLKTSEGKFFVYFVHDVSMGKQAEGRHRESAELLARSNGEFDEFAYAASHDLKEPLRAVAGACQLLERRLAGRINEEEQAFIGIAVDGAKRMQDLISGLLDYSRVTTTAKVSAASDCELVFEKILASLRLKIEESGAVVTHDPLPVILADAAQITRVLMNLIGNAIKFHGESPARIHVSAIKEEFRWVFSVRDDGIGIESKYFDRIFVIFRRLHTRESYDGIGLGLTLCKKIVERHGGKMWLQSIPNKGSTFFFSLPHADCH